MITEFAEIEVKPGTEQTFRDGVAACKPLFARAPGCHGLELHHAIEHPLNFLLVIKWDAVQDHINMTQSPDFQTWRATVGACFAGKPKVFHANKLL
jgi:quinol monooxygenase YgiN